MGGKSKKQTIGYKYYLGQHVVMCHGPIDAVTRFTVDDRIAWQGFNQGGTVNFSAESLFGGEKREGGVSGMVDIAMGGPTQLQNNYLVSQLGSSIPAYRGVVSAIFRQCYLGNNPYLKPWRFRAQRVQYRQNGIAQWYPSRAPIIVEAQLDPAQTYGFNQLATNFGSAPATTYSPGRGGIIRISKPRAAASGGLLTWDAWSAWNNDAGIGGGGSPVPGQTWNNRFEVWASNGGGFTRIFSANEVGLSTNLYATIDEAYDAVNALLPLTFTGWDTYRIQAAFDNNPGDNRGGISLLVQFGSGTIDLNGAHIVREALTDPDWGMGYTDADIDDDAFQLAANTLASEGLGLSMLWDKQIKIEEFVDTVRQHIDAALYVSRKTGKFVLKLIRGGYDESTLPIFDERNVSRVEEPVRIAFGELVNSVTVNYWDAATGKDASLTVTDTAMVQVQGAVINTPLQYPGFSNSRNASIAAQRDLRALSTPLLSCTLYTDSSAKDLEVGDVFRFRWKKWGITQLIVMRVTGIAYGTGRSTQIRINCTEDVFDTPATGIITTPDDGWSDPSQPPTPTDAQIAVEAPYYELVQTVGQSSTDDNLANNPESGYVLGASARAPSSINANLLIDDGTGYAGAGTLEFCPYAALVDPVGKLETVFNFSDGRDLDQVVIGQHAQIDDELVRVDSVDTIGGTITVGRGVLDTVPAPHDAGSDILFWDSAYATDPTEYVAGETIDVKILPVSGAGVVDISLATPMTVEFDQRAFRPYPPGDLLINGLSYDSSADYEGVLTVEWVGRDRLQQTSGTLADHFDGNIGPEPGTTYRISVYIDDVLDQQIEPAVSGDGVTPSDPGTVRIEVHSKRDDVYSWQAPWHEFLYGAVGQRAVESGDTRFAEDGEVRVTEDT